MLLSVPLTMTAKIALEANPDTAWLGYLLGPAEGESQESQQALEADAETLVEAGQAEAQAVERTS